MMHVIQYLPSFLTKKEIKIFVIKLIGVVEVKIEHNLTYAQDQKEDSLEGREA